MGEPKQEIDEVISSMRNATQEDVEAVMVELYGPNWREKLQEEHERFNHYCKECGSRLPHPDDFPSITGEPW